MSKKKTGGKFAAKKKKTRKVLKILLVIVSLLLVALVAMLLILSNRETPQEDTQDTEIPTSNVIEATEAESLPTTPTMDNKVNLGYGIQVIDMGSYTGMYMEDGTDEIVSGILMLVVENTGEQDIQYAEITIDFGTQQAMFNLTTLPAGAKMVLLEKNRMQWEDSWKGSTAIPMASNVAYFLEPISKMEEKLSIGTMDGTINVANISGEDIPGNIVIYYKNVAGELFYGGITYRITIEGGLKAEEIRQIMSAHFHADSSEIVMVSCGG